MSKTFILNNVNFLSLLPKRLFVFFLFTFQLTVLTHVHGLYIALNEK